MNIDKGLNQFLGLPDSYNLDRETAYKLYTELKKITFGKSVKMSKIVLMLYIDNYGDFTKSKTRIDLIMNAILKNMNKNDQFEILKYASEQN